MGYAPNERLRLKGRISNPGTRQQNTFKTKIIKKYETFGKPRTRYMDVKHKKPKPKKKYLQKKKTKREKNYSRASLGLRRNDILN